MFSHPPSLVLIEQIGNQIMHTVKFNSMDIVNNMQGNFVLLKINYNITKTNGKLIIDLLSK